MITFVNLEYDSGVIGFKAEPLYSSDREKFPDGHNWDAVVLRIRDGNDARDSGINIYLSAQQLETLAAAIDGFFNDLAVRHGRTIDIDALIALN